jgi:hypothetical protein
MSQKRVETLMRGLIGHAYPNAESIGEDGRRFVRRWVVRCKRELPDQPELDIVATTLTTGAQQALRDAYGDVIGSDPAYCLPLTDIVRISPSHCVACVEAPTHKHAVGDDAAIATWLVLRGIDQAFEIEELEGIPKDYWFQLR